jgi:hypothetical protein
MRCVAALAVTRPESLRAGSGPRPFDRLRPARDRGRGGSTRCPERAPARREDRRSPPPGRRARVVRDLAGRSRPPRSAGVPGTHRTARPPPGTGPPRRPATRRTASPRPWARRRAALRPRRAQHGRPPADPRLPDRGPAPRGAAPTGPGRWPTAMEPNLASIVFRCGIVSATGVQSVAAANHDVRTRPNCRIVRPRVWYVVQRAVVPRVTLGRSRPTAVQRMRFS